MPRVRLQFARSGPARAGFSLVELLVVIAIIAVLAALLFPAFAAVREKARQNTVLDNFRQIQSGIAQYRLDYHKAPDVLFGWADAGTGSSMTGFKPSGPTLFPNFVRDASVFTDPNNPTDDLTQQTGALAVNTLVPGAAGTGTLSTTVTHKFFVGDAYDVGPQVGPDSNLVDPPVYVPRYQANWTGVGGAAVSDADYQRQMRWPNPASNTYVTCTTYHVPKGKVIVLWESGSAEIIDTARFLGPGPDAASLSVPASVSFWRVKP